MKKTIKMYILWSKGVGGWHPEIFDNERSMEDQAESNERLGVECKRTVGVRPRHRDNFSDSATVPGPLGG